jgi:hypothetical protein
MKERERGRDIERKKVGGERDERKRKRERYRKKESVGRER